MGPVSELIDPDTGPSSPPAYMTAAKCLSPLDSSREASPEQRTVLGEPGVNAGMVVVQWAQ